MAFRRRAERKRRKRRVLTLWVLSYAVLVALMLAVMGASFLLVLRVVRDSAMRSHDVALRQIESTIDSTILDIERFSNSININSRIIALSKIKQELSPAQLLEIPLAMKDLRIWAEAANRFDEFFIYMQNSDLIIGANSSMRSYDYYITSEYPELIGYEAWMALISRDSGRHFVQLGGDPASILYAGRFPQNLTAVAQNLSTVIRFKKTSLFAPFAGMNNLKGASLMVMDDMGMALSNFDDEDVALDLDYNSLPDARGRVDVSLSGQRYIVSCAASNYWRLKYVSVIPYQVFWTELLDITR
ncbi:MAG: hypothetical protein LBL83_00190, partial [Clostridiales bacterium]|nr:hypothetical protein [Clostridiales bacterium]